MGSDDFIDLCTPGVSDDETENNEEHDRKTGSSEADFQPTSEVKDGIDNGEKFEESEVGCGSEGSQVLQTVDLKGNLVPGQPIMKESIELTTSVTVVDEIEEVKVGQVTENGGSFNAHDSFSSDKIDENYTSGVKGARMTCDDQQPFVHVTYSSLTRDSKRKLEELLQQWSEWHALNVSSSNVSSKEGLENGEGTYFSALNVGSKKCSAVSFWMDNQARADQKKDGDSVPLYDRGYLLGLTSLDGSANHDGGMETYEASRCFNCGSYNHSLKECPKPRDNVAVSNARKQHSSKRNAAAGPRLPTRYYQNSPGGKFEGLKPGVLGAETRQCLGIGELDPPPWLNRMREIGYPPGYLEAEDQSSGITIFADEETKEDHEDGEILEAGESEPPLKKMAVEFPGINAPIPENADQRRWTASPDPYNSSRNRSHGRSNYHSSEGSRGHYHDQKRTRDNRDIGPPGVDLRTDHSVSNCAQRYRGYDSYYSNEAQSPRGNNAIPPRSPSLSRSQSDRGWRGHRFHESSPSHSPYSTIQHSSSSLTRHSPHSYGPASFEGWARESYDLSSPRRDWHDQHHHQRN